MKFLTRALLHKFEGADWLLQRKARSLLALVLVSMCFLVVDLVLTSLAFGHKAPQYLPSLAILLGLGSCLVMLARGHYQVAGITCLVFILFGISYARWTITGAFASSGAYDLTQYVLDLVVVVAYANLIASRKRTLIVTLSACALLMGGYVYWLAERSRAAASPAETSVYVSGFLFLVIAGMINILLFQQNQKAIEIARKEARASRASDELFSRAFAMCPDAFAITRVQDGVYLAINEGFTRISGYTSADMVGRSALYDARPLWARAGERDLMIAGLREKGEVHNLEATFRKKDGGQFQALMSARYIEIDGEQHILSVTRDITERRRDEQERAKLQAQLQQAQKMESLGSLAGGVAHDMNNVLGAILGMATTNLAALPADSPAHRAFDTIARAAVRGGDMVKSLLSFARQQPAELRELDLNAILREEVRLLEATTLSRVTLELDLADALRPVRGDATLLANAFMNVCVNAVDAMPGPGTLTLRTRNLDGGWIEATVTDTGAGMPEDVLEQALDPFFTTKETGKGTGLGLSMVYSTVKAHQGELEIQSEAGRGTCVRMRFPSCAAGDRPAEPLAADRQETPMPRLKVLLVDDDELIQSAVQATLEALGHTVVPAPSGEAALALLDTGPDLAILDMNMPGLGGAGTLPLLRAQRPGLPVLLATGRVDQTALDLARDFPGVTLLAKPFGMEDLRQAIRDLAAQG